jgi:sugar/nucleoside kinase (ribokinase family)
MTAKQYDVVGIGVAAVDDLFYIERYPELNVKVPATGTERHGGGPACTAMAAVGTLGGKAAYVARFGTNDLAAFMERALAQRGVETCVVRDPQGGPYHSFIVVDASGNRNVFYDASLYRTVEGEHVPAVLVQKAAMVLVDHVADPALLSAAEAVRKLGVPILGDIEGCTEAARQLAAKTDYLIVPEEFATWASGASEPNEACGILARTKRRATVVTSGTKGCYYRTETDSEVRHIPAFAVDSHDTNGCGDTFHGAFALATARGFAAAEALTFASAAAALKAFAGGGNRRGWSALPTARETLDFLRARLADTVGSEALRNKVAAKTAALAEEVEAAKSSEPVSR